MGDLMLGGRGEKHSAEKKETRESESLFSREKKVDRVRKDHWGQPERDKEGCPGRVATLGNRRRTVLGLLQKKARGRSERRKKPKGALENLSPGKASLALSSEIRRMGTGSRRLDSVAPGGDGKGGKARRMEVVSKKKPSGRQKN